MTDPRFDSASADGELLSAYLAGELDPAADAELEARLAAEPELRAQLDALADALVTLGGFDAVEPPEGYEQRLDERLAAQPGAPADLDAHRRRRAAPSRWVQIGAVAAVLVAGALMAGTMLRGASPVGGGDAAMEAADSAGGDETTAEQYSAESSRPDAPVILDEDVPIAGEAELRRRYSGVPEAQGLLGTPRREARELAMVFADAVNRRTVSGVSADAAAAPVPDSAGDDAAAVESGDAAAEQGSGESDQDPATESMSEMALEEPKSQDRASAAEDPCLAAITAGAASPLVPVRVETLRYAGEPAIAYVLVTAKPGSRRLDRTEVWVVKPDDCTTLVFQQY